MATRWSFFASLANIPFNLALYSIGAAQLSGSAGARFDWRKVLNMPVIATLLSVVLLLSRIHVPAVIADTISTLAGATIPLSMLIIGTSLGAISVRAALADWRVYVVSAVRLLVCPLLTWLVLRPFVSGALLGIPVLLAACPSAMVVTALCLQYDRSDAFASKCIFSQYDPVRRDDPAADLAAVLTGAWVLFSLVLCPLTPSCKGNWQPSD